MVTSRSRTPHGVSSGFMRTMRSWRPKLTCLSQRVTVSRAESLFSGVTASSRSRTRESAGRARDFCNIFSFAPGTKCTARRNRAIISSGIKSEELRMKSKEFSAFQLFTFHPSLFTLSPHHRRPLATHHNLAALVGGAVFKHHDAPLRTGFRFALLQHL